ncbi:MAG TPA: sodium-dependent transporter [Candidatus Aenigmarchaeota archaeon]|nr:sodium-dependent transporter [Candidatus Aenigmarchaeota archaeon]
MEREHWSKIGFILASIGSAVGLGNVWRFPYIVGENGGGAFLIPYFIAVLFFAVPVMMIEFAAGRRFDGSVLTTLKRINPKIKPVGLVPVTVNLFILSYYLVVTGWTFAYFIFSLLGYMEFEVFIESGYSLFLFLGILLLTAIIVNLGIKKGIERTCRYLLPVLFIFILILAIRSVSLPGMMEGISFYLTPDLSVLSNPNIWILAFGQAFFSLSVGFGIMLTYGSYLDRREDVPKSVLVIAGADTLIAILAGFIIFPVVFSFGFNPAAGPELAFITLPKIFSVMFLGQIFGAAFFFLLFIGAVTSAISMFEVGVTTLIDELKMSRIRATALVTCILGMIGLPSALSYSGFDIHLFGRPFLDSVDIIFGSLITPISAALLCISIAWFWKPKELWKEINRNTKLKIPFFIVYLVRYLIPAILVFSYLKIF